MCLIDGDNTIFSRELILLGQEGGKAAAAQLAKAIQEHLHMTTLRDLHIYAFLNKSGCVVTMNSILSI
jgi:hypothetical protein